jgi:hypothetical protein
LFVIYIRSVINQKSQRPTAKSRMTNRLSLALEVNDYYLRDRFMRLPGALVFASEGAGIVHLHKFRQHKA